MADQFSYPAIELAVDVTAEEDMSLWNIGSDGRVATRVTSERFEK
jgi:hypothetical protein